MKVLFYTNIPSPYRVAFFNELGKYCDLTVVFETGSSTERNELWKQFKFDNFKGIVLKGIRTRVDSAFCPEIIKFLKKGQYDYIVVTQLASMTAIWSVMYMKLMRIPYCYEGDGGFVGNTKGLKALLKKIIIGNASFCLSTSEEFDKYCLAYGANKIYRYSFSSVEDKDVLCCPMEKDNKHLQKEKLGIKEEYAVISVGQFIYRKGFDILLEVSRFLPYNVGIYIVGGKPTEEYLKIQRKWDLQNVHFVDFMSKDKLMEYYKASDLFVLPTREDIWGLVVNEAMSCGLPVVSTQKCIAALEMVQNGENGYVVPVDDVLAVREAVETILGSETLQRKMSCMALQTVRERYTVENMAREHIQIFEKESKGI